VSRYRCIAEEKARHSVVLLCRVLGAAKSAFYVWQQQQLSQPGLKPIRYSVTRSKTSTTTATARMAHPVCMPSCADAASTLAANVWRA
jgi:hypothetical protein